ncbi:hypothetical protein V6N13_098225 [Hibiscus sabdariffa]
MIMKKLGAPPIPKNMASKQRKKESRPASHPTLETRLSNLMEDLEQAEILEVSRLRSSPPQGVGDGDHGALDTIFIRSFLGSDYNPKDDILFRGNRLVDECIQGAANKFQAFEVGAYPFPRNCDSRSPSIDSECVGECGKGKRFERSAIGSGLAARCNCGLFQFTGRSGWVIPACHDRVWVVRRGLSFRFAAV